jgi:hypothetical protein
MCVRQNSSDLSKEPIPSSNLDLSKKAGSSSKFDSVLPAQPMVWIPKNQTENQIQNQPKTQN